MRKLLKMLNDWSLKNYTIEMSKWQREVLFEHITTTVQDIDKSNAIRLGRR